MCVRGWMTDSTAGLLKVCYSYLRNYMADLTPPQLVIKPVAHFGEFLSVRVTYVGVSVVRLIFSSLLLMIIHRFPCKASFIVCTVICF